MRMHVDDILIILFYMPVMMILPLHFWRFLSNLLSHSNLECSGRKIPTTSPTTLFDKLLFLQDFLPLHSNSLSRSNLEGGFCKLLFLQDFLPLHFSHYTSSVPTTRGQGDFLPLHLSLHLPPHFVGSHYTLARLWGS